MRGDAFRSFGVSNQWPRAATKLQNSHQQVFFLRVGFSRTVRRPVECCVKGSLQETPADGGMGRWTDRFLASEEEFAYVQLDADTIQMYSIPWLPEC
jgi:hypothetical protein